jgi:hypothetical protein
MSRVLSEDGTMNRSKRYFISSVYFLLAEVLMLS